jgi:hypothetical protein
MNQNGLLSINELSNINRSNNCHARENLRENNNNIDTQMSTQIIDNRDKNDNSNIS